MTLDFEPHAYTRPCLQEALFQLEAMCTSGAHKSFQASVPIPHIGGLVWRVSLVMRSPLDQKVQATQLTPSRMLRVFGFGISKAPF